MRIAIQLLLGSLLILGTGCALDREFVEAVDGYSRVILPEYRAYVKSDDNLSEDSKRIRLQTADRFKALIDEARKEP